MPQQATTIRRAKAQYRKSGPQITPAEARRLERSLELEKRARAIQDREERKRQAERAKVVQERKDREARRQMGIGLATQLAGYSHSQKAMKGGMEGWLGLDTKSESRTSFGKNGRALARAAHINEGEQSEKKQKTKEEEDGISISASPNDSFGSTSDLEDLLREQSDEDGNVKGAMESYNTIGRAPTIGEAGNSSTHKPHNQSQVTKKKRKYELGGTLPTPEIGAQKRAKTTEAPDDNWQSFLEGNTQIDNDVQLSSPPGLQPTVDVIPPISSQDFELGSDDFLDVGLPRVMYTSEDGICVRDFAYSTIPLTESITINAPGAPKVPRSFRSTTSMLRSFGGLGSVMTPPSKMTATCAAFTAAQCSFSTEMHDLGFSTQILQDAIDAGDDDTEDEDEEVYSRAIAECKVPDNVLMPPPPVRTSPTIFKPPGPSSLFAAKGGLHIFGLSTQILQDAILAEDDDNNIDDDTDESEDGGLFSVPIQRPMHTTTGLMTPKPELAQTNTASAKPDATQYEAFELSTQVLKDALSDDVLLTDDDDNEDTQKA